MTDEMERYSALSEGANQILEFAFESKDSSQHADLGVHHFLLALLQRNGAMAEGMVEDLDSEEKLEELRTLLQSGNVGTPMEIGKIVELATERARKRGKSRAVERDLAAVILTAAEYPLENMAGNGRESADEKISPVDLSSRLSDLRKELQNLSLMEQDEIEFLIKRLGVTDKDLDFRPERPNAVLMMVGELAGRSASLGAALAGAYFGDLARETVIDLARCDNPYDLMLRLGPPDNQTGETPMRKLRKEPRSVVRFENIDACHPSVGEIITRAIEHGFLSNGRGNRYSLGETVVILTASRGAKTQRLIGFRTGDEEAPYDYVTWVETYFGAEFAEQVDMVLASELSDAVDEKTWVEKTILRPLANRYQSQDITISWSSNLVNWLLDECGESTNLRDWERFVEESIAPSLVEHLPTSQNAGRVEVVIDHDGTELRFTRQDEGS